MKKGRAWKIQTYLALSTHTTATNMDRAEKMVLANRLITMPHISSTIDIRVLWPVTWPMICRIIGRYRHDGCLRNPTTDCKNGNSKNGNTPLRKFHAVREKGKWFSVQVYRRQWDMGKKLYLVNQVHLRDMKSFQLTRNEAIQSAPLRMMSWQFEF